LENLDRYLSKKDMKTCLEIINNSTLCSSQEEYYRLMNCMKSLVGYEYDICVLAGKNSDGTLKSSDILNISYPDELLAIYFANSWDQVDPIYKKNFNRFELQYWCDTFREFGEPKNMRSVYDDFNIKKGYAYGIRNFSGNLGSIFCFGTEDIKKEKHTELIMKLIIPHLHQAMSRILDRRDTIPGKSG
jgi:hypothetical protein